MKQYKRIIALVMTGTLLMGSLTGCKSKETTIETERQNVLKDIAETEFDFIKNGTCEYKVVYPNNATENEKFAVSELEYFINGATGSDVESLSEAEAEQDGKYIYVGATQAATEAKVAPTYEEVQYNGFVMKQIDDDLYLRGYSDIGTRNAVYEFLTYAFNYEFYAEDEIRLCETKNAKMLAYDEMVTPSFDWREGNYGEIIFNSTTSHRMRFNETEEILVLGHTTHNSMLIIDPFEYDWKSEQYKDWFSNSTWTGAQGSTNTEERPTQLCYSSEEMRVEYTKKLIKLLETSKAPNMLLGMEDNIEWCTCDKCAANREKYGTDAATMIHFVNKVQADVDEWFAQNRPDEEPVKLVMFAYYCTVNPPTTYDEKTETWLPMDDSVVLNDHSGVMFAPIRAEYDVPFESKEISDVSYTHGQITGWAALSKNLYAWTYALLPSSGLVFFDTLEAMQQNYKLLEENDVVMLLDQTDHYQKNINSGFSRLKAYVMSKLQWNTSLNMNELIDDFFDNYFAEAADTMQDLFNQEREWLTNVYANKGAEGYISDNLVDSQYWSYNQLQSYMQMINKAYEDIEGLRETNPDRYAKLYDRILIESMQFRYLLIQIYYTEYSDSALLEAKKEFRYDFERLGFTAIAENTDITLLWQEWGID